LEIGNHDVTTISKTRVLSVRISFTVHEIIRYTVSVVIPCI